MNTETVPAVVPYRYCARLSPAGVCVSSELDLGQLANILAERAPVKARELADIMGVEYPTVRDALIRLEGLGIVYRTGKTRGTRWWLG